MLDIDISRAPHFAVVRAVGSLVADDEADTLAGALAFVPDDEDLVVDLSGLELLDARCATVLCGQLLQRVVWSEAVVVSLAAGVTMQLIGSEVDRVVPIVRDVRRAAEVISARRGAAMTRTGC